MTQSQAQIAVRASGLVSSVGFNSQASCAAMRAGIDAMAQANLWDAESGAYLNAGKVNLPHWWTGLGKLAELVAPAIYECLQAAQPVPAGDIPILLGVAGPDRPNRWNRLDERILEEIAYRLDLPRHPASAVIAKGQVSGIYGLQLARELIATQRVPCCIVAGVDSYLDQKTIVEYLDQRRILTPVNSNGFIPGEAGGAVLISQADNKASQAIRVLGMGFGREAATIASDKPFDGSGMVQAVRQALSEAACNLADTSYRITDLNGEHYKFKEAVFVVSRLLHERKCPVYDLWHPIEFTGEIGSAIVPCILAVAGHAGVKGYAPGRTFLCHVGSDDGLRAALIARFEDEVRG